MSYIGNQPTQIAFVTDSFSGNGSQTVFTMSVAPANTASVLIAVGGSVIAPSAYSVSGTTLTFSTAPASGTANISVRYLGIPASGITTTAFRTETIFTATAGQTTFTPPSYTAGFINVFRNGVLLTSVSDYTATNGTTVVLATGANLSDTIIVQSYYVSSVANAIPNTAGAVNSTNLAQGLSASINTLNMTSGVFATQNGMTGIAKVWVNYSILSVATIIGSFNVSSLTRNGTGDVTVNFTTAMPNATYCAVTASNANVTNNGVFNKVGDMQTTYVRIQHFEANSLTDCNNVYCAIFSS